jgi:LPXTG-motif cell wall-anchored protein
VDEDGDTTCEGVIADGSWSCTPTDPISEGDHTFTPKIKDKAGNATEGDPVKVTVDATAPDAPKDVTCSTNSDGTVTCEGTGEPGDAVDVVDDNGDPVCSVTVGDDGKWSCTSEKPVEAFPVSVIVKDPAGNESDPVVTPVPPTMTSPSADKPVGDSTPTFEGTGNDGDTVKVVDENGDTVCETTVADGKWSCTPDKAIGDGEHTFTPIVVGDDGTESAGRPVKTTIDTEAPKGPGDVTCSVNPDKTVTCTGTGEPGDTADVVDDNGNPVCSVTVGDDGKWSCTSTGPVKAFPLSVVITDPAGNSSDPVTLPAPPGAIECSTNPDNTVTCSGTGTPGDEVVVSDGDGNRVCSVTVGEDGKWTCTSDGPVKNPPLSVTVTDGAGNTVTVPGIPVAGAEPEPGNGGGDSDGGGNGGGDLPRTGFTGTGIAIGGGIVVLLGAGALFLTRRRKR